MGHYRERTSQPHLSLSVPHCSQVLPPKSLLERLWLAKRSCGMGTLQDFAQCPKNGVIGNLPRHGPQASLAPAAVNY
jgi:hypothetical protein